MSLWEEETWFRPEWQLRRPIHIIGVGCLGSRYAMRLVRAGADDIHLYDGDVVEHKNLRNQEYAPEDVGRPKVYALERQMRLIQPHVRVTTHNAWYTPEMCAKGIVMWAVDRNKKRQAFWPAMRGNKSVSFLVDARLGATQGRAYGVDPCNDGHVEIFENDLVDDPVRIDGGCAETPNATATADILAGMALWRLGRWFHLEQGCPDPYTPYVGFTLTPTVGVEYTES